MVHADADLFEAHRDSTAAGFDPPRPLSELSTVVYDGDPSVSPDDLGSVALAAF